MLVSIVTVCYNAEHSIEKTMKSVLNQTYGEIEYIIKDGESTDNTNDIIESYRLQFENRGIRFFHLVKSDNGIYDAMNQATEIASGEYINYMNADDMFFDNNVLEKVFGDGMFSKDVLYGDAVCEYEFIKGKKEYTIWKGQHQNFASMPFSHQACFIKTGIIKNYYYDVKYRSAADYNLLLKLFKDGKVFQNMKFIISLCTMDGVSNTKIATSYNETIQIKKELQMEQFIVGNLLLSMWFMRVKQWVLANLPYMLVGRLLRFQVKRKGNRVFKSIGEINSIL